MRQKAIGFLLLCAALVAACLYLSQRSMRQTQQDPPSANGWTQVELSQLPRYRRDDADFSADSQGGIFYPDAQQGIDVSEHQGKIDWQKVREDGISFAILRVAYRGYTEGRLAEDATFRENLAAARDAGIELGAYVFSQALNEQEAEEEAAFALSILDGAPLELPIYFDWEHVSGDERADRLTGEQVTRNALAFCRAVEDAGYRGGVYFNSSVGYWKLTLPVLAGYNFWLAQYEPAPYFFYDFHMWQYSDHAEVDGIETAVDRNLRFNETTDSP